MPWRAGLLSSPPLFSLLPSLRAGQLSSSMPSAMTLLPWPTMDRTPETLKENKSFLLSCSYQAFWSQRRLTPGHSAHPHWQGRTTRTLCPAAFTAASGAPPTRGSARPRGSPSPPLPLPKPAPLLNAASGTTVTQPVHDPQSPAPSSWRPLGTHPAGGASGWSWSLLSPCPLNRLLHLTASRGLQQLPCSPLCPLSAQAPTGAPGLPPGSPFWTTGPRRAMAKKSLLAARQPQGEAASPWHVAQCCSRLGTIASPQPLLPLTPLALWPPPCPQLVTAGQHVSF